MWKGLLVGFVVRGLLRIEVFFVFLFVWLVGLLVEVGNMGKYCFFCWGLFVLMMGGCD